MKPMRKIIVGLLLLTATRVEAQKPSYLVGISGSAAIGKLYGNSILKMHKYAPGFSGGLTFEMKMKQNFSLCTALQFDRKGDLFETNMTGFGPNPVDLTKFHSRLSYLTIPLALRKTIGKKSQYFVNIGTYASYLLSYTLITENSLGRNKTTASGFNPIDIGIIAGAGVQFHLVKNYRISFEARESLGLLNISSLPVINNGTIKTNFIQLLIGVSKLKEPS